MLYSTVRHRGGKRLAQTYSLANVTRGINRYLSSCCVWFPGNTLPQTNTYRRRRYKKKGGNRNEDIEDSILGNPKSASRSKMEWTMTLQCDLQTRRATVLAPQHWGRLKVIRSCVRSTRDSALERSATLYDVTSHPVSEVRQIEHIVDGKLQGGNVHMPPAEAGNV